MHSIPDLLSLASDPENTGKHVSQSPDRISWLRRGCLFHSRRLIKFFLTCVSWHDSYRCFEEKRDLVVVSQVFSFQSEPCARCFESQIPFHEGYATGAIF